MNSAMMQFEAVAAIVAVLAIGFLFAGYKLLASSEWLGGWLRGNLGIFCVLLTGMLVLCVMDVRTYLPMFDDKTVATLSLRETTPHHYEVRLVDALGVETRYAVSGDSWRISANQFRWSRRLSLGLGHGYRFTALEGLNTKASGEPASTATLSHSRYLDVWNFFNQHAPSNSLFSTALMVTPPQPLADAAMYEVVPSGFDLAVKPLNELAKRAQLAAAPTAAAPDQAATMAPAADAASTPAATTITTTVTTTATTATTSAANTAAPATTAAGTAPAAPPAATPDH